MPYNENIAARILEKLIHIDDIEERYMFGGLVLMVNGKMCICLNKRSIMVRVEPDRVEELAELEGCQQMVHGGKPFKGFVFVDYEVLETEKQLSFWVDLALEYNPFAQAKPRNKG